MITRKDGSTADGVSDTVLLFTLSIETCLLGGQFRFLRLLRGLADEWTIRMYSSYQQKVLDSGD